MSNAPSSYSFTNRVNRSLVANFVAVPRLSFSASQANAMAITWPTNNSGFVLQHTFDLSPPHWFAATNRITITGADNKVTITPSVAQDFFRLIRP